jgi:hypothetical protein
MENLEEVNFYLRTVDRLEPNIHMIDPGAYYASAAISLRRLADSATYLTNVIKAMVPLALADPEISEDVKKALKGLTG